LTKAQNSYKDLSELQTAVDTLPGARREAANKLIAEIVFLEQTMGKLKSSVNISGGVLKTARTVRENPALKAYNTSIQRYSLLFKQVVDMLPEPPKAAPVDPLLDFVKEGA
jgi:hypothetical protein